ncbi:MAG: helix-turn-helix domain-containing protein [Coriobacteriales bacterium]
MFVSLFLDCLCEELERRIAFLLQDTSDEGFYPYDIKRGEETLGILCHQPASTAASLAQVMGLSSRQVQRILRELREGGFVEHVGSDRRGKWELQ